MNIQPLRGRVLVERVDGVEVSRGGIIIPHAAKERSNEGVVVAIGGNNGEVKRGNRVLFGKYAGVDLILGNKEYLMLHIADLSAIIED